MKQAEIFRQPRAWIFWLKLSTALVVGAVLLFLLYALAVHRAWIIYADGRWYTHQGFYNTLPPEMSAKVYQGEPKNKPEDVYASFWRAVRNNDTETALEQIIFWHRDEHRQRIFGHEKYEQWRNNLPETIKFESYNDMSASADECYYEAIYGDGRVDTFNFIVSPDGYWKIRRIN